VRRSDREGASQKSNSFGIRAPVVHFRLGKREVSHDIEADHHAGSDCGHLQRFLGRDASTWATAADHGPTQTTTEICIGGSQSL
jgi:hypothetical protein